MSYGLFARALAIGAILAGGTASAVSAGPDPLTSKPRTISSPAGAGSGEPFLAVDEKGTVWMSWLEWRRASAEDGHALRLAKLDGRRWSDAQTIAEGDSFFVNWADFPTVLPLPSGRMTAHWPWMSGGDSPYAYDVMVSQSADAGATWTAPQRPHEDGTATEHGFVSMVPEGDGVRMVWLDGREFAKANGIEEDEAHGHDMKGEMTLRSALLHADGRISDDALLDARVCDCCQTAAVRTSRGVLVAYRDRSAKEVRDISLVRLEDGEWSEPYPLHVDDWEIAACPVNGPALDAFGDRVAAAWFTGAGEYRVWIAFSDDGGVTFGDPVRADEGSPAGRVDVVQLDDGSALVSWLESHGENAEIRVRRIGRDGASHPPWTLARTRSARASGFPRMVRSGERLVFAWTEAGETPRVRTAVVRLESGAANDR